MEQDRWDCFFLRRHCNSGCKVEKQLLFLRAQGKDRTKGKCQGPEAGIRAEMACLRERSEGRVMECGKNELGQAQDGGREEGSPYSCGVSEGKSRSLGFVLGGRESGLSILSLVFHEPGNWHLPRSPNLPLNL